MGKQGAQEGNCCVMANQRNFKRDSELSLSRPQLDAPPPATASAEEVLGATSPSTADCENCSEGVPELQREPHLLPSDLTCKSDGFRKLLHWPRR